MKQEPRILVVEDESAVARILSSLLERRGFKVDIASSVGEATGVLENQAYDVGIFDWKLLDGNGLDLAASLRAKGNEMPVIFVTGFANNDLAMSAAQLGIHDIISKPFSSAELYASLERVLPDFKPPAAKKMSVNLRESVQQDEAPAAPVKAGLPAIVWILLVFLLLIVGVLGTFLIIG